MRNFGPFVGVLLILGFFGLLFYMEYNIWTECRQTNSWFYCFRMVTR